MEKKVSPPEDSGAALGNDSGAAYLFHGINGQWRQISMLAQGGSGGHFGMDVALGRDSGIFGARGEDSYTGAAYSFDYLNTLCLADVNGDGVVNTLDVLAYLNLWASGCP